MKIKYTWRCTILADTLKLEALAAKNKALVDKQGSAHLTLPGNLIDKSLISKEALQVIRKLHTANYRAYLVGGGVRDLLLGKAPKDFDVVTDATPEQVKKIFNRSRIIGRRFRLVHVIFNNTIIEVATFRRKEDEVSDKNKFTSENGMLLRDNQYGTNLSEDAIRRDYSINALYYSPYENAIHDYHGGFYDLLHGNIEIIGDPNLRFREDPVRMIRAYRFAAKLGFTITDRTKELIPDLLPLLKQIPAARMFEEFNKLFLTGHGAQSFELIMSDSVMQYLLTEQGSLLEDHEFFDFIHFSLVSSDQRYNQGKRNMPHFLYAVMLWPLVEHLYRRMTTLEKYMFLKPEQIMEMGAKIVLGKQNEITSIPAKAVTDIIDIWKMLIELEEPQNQNNPEQLVWRGIFRASMDFFILRSHFDPELKPIAKLWQSAYEFYVPIEMRSRKSLIKQQEENPQPKKTRFKARVSQVKRENGPSPYRNEKQHNSSKKSFRRQKPSAKNININAME
jgi:poly(A) polymerase